MKEIIIEAKTDNLDQVLGFVDEELERLECSMKIQMQIDLAVEEIFVNIANYAYNPNVGMATIQVGYDSESQMVSITFIDEGTPYDPLAKKDPDVSLSADERQIGGLGIYLVKKNMDDVIYEYKDNRNILVLKRKLE